MRPELYSLIALIAGFVAARLASAGVASLLRAAGRRAARLTTSGESLLTPEVIGIVRQLVFWLLLAATFVLALSFLGVGAINQLVTVTISLVPSVLIAIAIIVAGHLAGLLASQLSTRVVAGTSRDSSLPRLVHGIIVAVAVIMALQQLGVDISFVTQLLLIVIAVGSGGFMLAFALGSRQHVANLLARRDLDRLRVGDEVEVAGVKGTIIGIQSTVVEIATADGTASVPAATFASAIVTRRPERDDIA